MFDFIRDLRKSDEEKRQEAITAYLDGHLSPAEWRQFEEKLATDPGLRHEVELQSFIKNNLRQLPQVRAPRNFTLDPALYGAPELEPAVRLYPILRTATVLVGIFFVIAVGAALLLPQGGEMGSLALAPMAGEVADDGRAIVTEVEQELMEAPIEEMASPIVEAEMLVEEEMAVEAPAEEVPAPAEETVAGTPPAGAALEADQVVEEALEQETVAEEAVSEGELEEAEPGISAAAPIPAEDQKMTEEAARAGGIGTKAATETPLVEAPLAEEALEAEAPPAEPLPTATPPTTEITPSSTPPILAELEPTSPAVGQALTQEETPVEEKPELEQDTGGDIGGIITPLLTFLVVILGIGVIMLSGATLWVRRKI